MKKYQVYIPYVTYTEHKVEADSPEQAQEIACNEGDVDRQLLDNCEVEYEYIEVKESKG